MEAIICDIKAIKKCDSNPSRIIDMINTIEKAHRDLIYLKREINNATIIGMIEGKLPQEIQTEWVKLVTGDKTQEVERVNFPKLLRLLSHFRWRIEYKNARLRNSSAVPTKQQTILNVTSSELPERGRPARKPWCWLHSSSTEHPIW